MYKQIIKLQNIIKCTLSCHNIYWRTFPVFEYYLNIKKIFFLLQNLDNIYWSKLWLVRSYPMDLNGARRKNATRETTSTLKAWLNEHKKNPYPTKGEKIMLAIITKMTLTQVSTWFANARRRLKKENKMTWEPRNRVEDDDVNLDDDDDHKSNDDKDMLGKFKLIPKKV